MKARAIGVNATIPAVVAVEVAVLAAIVIFPPARISWWPTAAVAVVAIALLMVTVYRRNAVKWAVDRVRWRRRRRRTESPDAAIDIPHGASLYGARVPDGFDGEAITMIEVTGQAYSPTLLTGSATALTPNRLPLDSLPVCSISPAASGCRASTWCPAACGCAEASATRRSTRPCLPTAPPRGSAERIWWCVSTSRTRSVAWRTAPRLARRRQRPPNAS